jgi:arylsulfatase A-like enzyme
MTETRREFCRQMGMAAGLGMALGAMPATAESEGSQVDENAERRPNILLLFPDQHRYDWLGTNPDLPLRTPNLDGLAARGVRFSQAYCPSPLCAPSRACLASGKEYDRCSVPTNKEDYPYDQTTFYTLLRDAGYHVAGCGKFDLHKGSPTWGVDGKHGLAEWGFSDGIDNAGKWDAINSGRETPKDPYMAYLKQQGLLDMHVADFMRRRKGNQYKGTFPTPLPEEAYCDNWVATNGLKLMARFPKGKPWFLQVNFTGPHDPLDITERMEHLARDRDFPQPNRSTQHDAETHNAIRQNYSAMVENLDRWTGLFLEELSRRGELDKTLVVYSSDHGEMLGDHDLWGKSKPHQPSVGVPLIVAGPGVKEGQIIDAPVTTLDLHATFLDAAGLPQSPDTDSRSLAPLLAGKTRSRRAYVLSGLKDWRMVCDGRHKLATGYGEKQQDLLFDLAEDPRENENIAGKAPEVVKRLREALAS